MAKKQTKGRLILLHWNADECKELAGPLRKGGWDVQEVASTDNLQMKDLRARPPVAMVISLRRLPSHGREVADALWYTRSGQAIPIIFFDGEPEKVEATRARFPAATFTSHEELLQTLDSLLPPGSPRSGKGWGQEAGNNDESEIRKTPVSRAADNRQARDHPARTHSERRSRRRR